MGLFQRAIETYDANAGLVGVYREGHEPLAPIGHVLTSANIEITLNAQGELVSARGVEKSEPKILIPVTEDSGARSSRLAAHPLCEQLKYVAETNEKPHELYLEGLQKWISSDFSHPFLTAVLAYASGGTILDDLVQRGILSSRDKYDEKLLVSWRVTGIEGEEPSCWKNMSLLSAFSSFYCEKIASERENALCMIDGRPETPAVQHPKGIIPINGNAKLVSANDTDGFTYRGRFADKSDASSVSFLASQKAHCALRWLASEQGVREFSGNRIFLCWSPEGKTVPRPMRGLRGSNSEVIRRPSDYKQRLQSTLMSFRQDNQLRDTDSAVLASFDAATTGRLSVTYYNELSLGVFLERMRDWDEHCCWYAGAFGIQAPSLLQIVNCAFGTQRDNYLETDNRVQRQHLQRLLDCKVSGGVFPSDVVRALVQRASSPQNYKETIWRRLVQTACSALQKYRYDTKQGGNEMAWELDKKDRSFQYGRLLAAMERLEDDYYFKTAQNRQTSAIKFMSEYRKRPFTMFERINRHLESAYLGRVEPWQAKRYRQLVGEIIDILRSFPESELNKPLDDIYLMGYELQRNTFFAKKPTEEKTKEE